MAKLERLITPSGVKTISENGEYDVASYEGVDVDVEVKARVEGTTLVIPKSTTAAPSMSAKFIERANNVDSYGRCYLQNSLDLNNKLYYVKCYSDDIGSTTNGILNTGIIKFFESDMDTSALTYITYNEIQNYIILDPIDSQYSLYNVTYIDIYELPITLPTIEGE